MKSHASVILAGIVYLLIPALQRALAAIRRAIARLMNRLDRLAFSLAGKLAAGEVEKQASGPRLLDADAVGPTAGTRISSRNTPFFTRIVRFFSE